MGPWRQRLTLLFAVLGPGVITGAAADDPSGMATYSQTGAQCGYGQLWTALAMLPLHIAVQEACARIGAVTGQGLAAVVRDQYSRPVLRAVVLLLLVANTLNIGADSGAMAAAATLLVPVAPAVLAITSTAVMVLLEIVLTSRVYARLLKWLTLALLAYPLTVGSVPQPWGAVRTATFLPHVEWTCDFLCLITGVLGTTISPSLFVWQAPEVVEEARATGRLVGSGPPRVSGATLRDLRLDNGVGMVFSEVGTWSSIVVTATVLHAHGVTAMGTAADAAQALEPLVQSFPHAGVLAKGLFAVGVIGMGVLGIAVLAGSAAYALAEALQWHEGLALPLRQAPTFYGILSAATLLGLAMNFLGIAPIHALISTAVINGVVAVPVLFVSARSAQIMGAYRSGWLSTVVLWLTCVAMGAGALGMGATRGTP